jgi:hypothetical protein
MLSGLHSMVPWSRFQTIHPNTPKSPSTSKFSAQNYYCNVTLQTVISLLLSKQCKANQTVLLHRLEFQLRYWMSFMCSMEWGALFGTLQFYIKLFLIWNSVVLIFTPFIVIIWRPERICFFREVPTTLKMPSFVLVIIHSISRM